VWACLGVSGCEDEKEAMNAQALLFTLARLSISLRAKAANIDLD